MKLIALYVLTTLFIVLVGEIRKKPSTKTFLKADSSFKGIKAALSICASWIWAPALFISTQIAYEWGISALFWFSLPNILALTVFGRLAKKVREKVPEGFSFFSLLEKMPKEDSARLALRIIFIGLQIGCLGIQVTAGAELLSISSNLPYDILVCVMVLLPLMYSFRSGLRSSVLTDWIQCLLILFAAFIFLYYFPNDFTKKILIQEMKPFQPFNYKLMTEFGLAASLTLIFGCFADQQAWQRAFAVPQKSIKKLFFQGALLHGIITFSLGLFGAWIYTTGYLAHNVQLVGGEFINKEMGSFIFALFVFMALSGLCSTVDSVYCAVSSLVMTEFQTKPNELRVGRYAMLFTALLGICIGFFRIPVITLWLMVGILRLSSVSAILALIFFPTLNTKAISRSIIFGALTGFPLFILGAITGNSIVKLLAILTCLLVSLLTLIYYWLRSTRSKLLSQKAGSVML